MQRKQTLQREVILETMGSLLTFFGPRISGNPGDIIIPESDPLTLRHYENGTRYNAWGVTDLPLMVGGELQYHYYYSSATMHGGQATSRRLRYYAGGDRIDDTEIWSDPDKSRRDFGGGNFTDDLGNQIHIVFYVEHDMTVANPPTVLWGMLGMGFYKYVYNAAGVLQSFTDNPNSFDLSTETDYANYGNMVRHPVTGRLYHMAYGTSGTGRGLLYISDDDGDTWTLHANFGFISSDSEGALAFLGGTTNANAILGYFVRNDVDHPDFWRSSDGGTTFSYYEQITTGTSTKIVSAWAATRPDNGNTMFLYCDRESHNYLIRSIEFDTATLSVDTIDNAVLSRRVIWESLINSRPFESSNLPGNFGYPSISFPPEGHPDRDNPARWPVVLYDMSPKQVQPYGSAFDPVQTDHIITPYEDQVRVKMWSNVNQTLTNGNNLIALQDRIIDTMGSWVSNRFICPKAGTYLVSFNFPRNNGNGASITFQVRKYLAATPTTLNSTPYSITEPDGDVGKLGKLQGYTSVTLAVGDVLDFYAVVSGATGTVSIDNQTDPMAGIYYGIDISNATTPITGGVQVKIAAASQSYSNTIPGLVTGTVVQDTDGAWSSGVFHVPKTAWYRIKRRHLSDNSTTGRKIYQTTNYEIGQESQDVRKKMLRQIEDHARTGANTEVDDVFYYRLNAGEFVKFWFLPYGSDGALVAGAFNAIEIDEV